MPIIISVFALTVILGAAFALMRAPSSQPKKSSPLAEWRWIRQGDFEVDFPGRPRPLKMRRELGKGWVIESLPLGKFLVAHYARTVLGKAKGPNTKLDPQKSLKALANSLAREYPRKMTSTLLPGPLHGIEIQRAQIGSGHSFNRFMRLRLILTPTRVYLIQWSGRAREDKRAAAGVNRFFDSFRLTKAALEPAS